MEDVKSAETDVERHEAIETKNILVAQARAILADEDDGVEDAALTRKLAAEKERILREMERENPVEMQNRKKFAEVRDCTKHARQPVP